MRLPRGTRERLWWRDIEAPIDPTSCPVLVALVAPGEDAPADADTGWLPGEWIDGAAVSPRLDTAGWPDEGFDVWLRIVADDEPIRGPWRVRPAA